MLAEKQHAQLRQALAQAAGGFQAADARQAEADDHKVGHRLMHARQGFFATGRVTHHHARQAAAQQSGIAQADHGVIIDQQDIHNASNGSGSRPMLEPRAAPRPTTLVLVLLSIVAFPRQRDWRVIGA